MFTSIDKFLAAFVTMVLALVSKYAHVSLGGIVSPETLASVITAIIPLVVYFVPNLPRFIGDGMTGAAWADKGTKLATEFTPADTQVKQYAPATEGNPAPKA